MWVCDRAWVRIDEPSVATIAGLIEVHGRAKFPDGREVFRLGTGQVQVEEDVVEVPDAAIAFAGAAWMDVFVAVKVKGDAEQWQR